MAEVRNKSFCSVPGCCCSARKQPYLSFHAFPADCDVRRKWIQAIQRKEGPNLAFKRESTSVCSTHFKSEDYIMGVSVNRLIAGAVPSIFPWNNSIPLPKREFVYERSNKRLSLLSVKDHSNKIATTVAKLDHDYATSPPTDSIQPSTSGHIQVTQKAVSQENPVNSYPCIHCTLIFRSRLYLFEHLNKVHRHDVDMALRNAGLKQTGTSFTNDTDPQNSLTPDQKCQHCDFMSTNRKDLKEHETYCQIESDKMDKETLSSPQHVPESLTAQYAASLTNQQNENPKLHQVCESECTTNSSKNLRIYRRPSQIVNEHLIGAPGAKVNVSVNIEDSAKETLVLKDSPQTTSPNRRGVFQVTAKTTGIDISNYSSCSFLQRDPLMRTKLRKPVEKREIEEESPKKVAKRIKSESPHSSPAKRAKSNVKAARDVKEEIEEKQHSPSSANISFEVSEDEAQDKMTDGDKALYFCKHCDYSKAGLGPMVAHYEDHHSYVRYNTAYIRDSWDESATFRCLQCPIEFVTTAGLKRHYTECHPEGPDVFTVKSSDVNMVFKCFLCSYIAPCKIALKEHHKEAHPKLNVGNSLSYCRYLETGNQKVLPQLNENSTPSQQEKSEESSSENITIPSTEVKSLTHQLKGADTTLYKCNNCTFIHKSVIVMHVHYKKSHPNEAITIDKIKLSAHIGKQKTSQHSDNPANSVTTVETKCNMDSLEKTEVKTEVSYQRKMKVVIPKCKVETINDLGSQKTEMVSVKKENKSKRVRNVTKEMPLSLDLSASLLTKNLFYCQFCSYTSTKARGVLSHHYANHSSLSSVVTFEEIVRYSAKIRKAETQQETSQESTLSFLSKTSEPGEVLNEMEDQCEPDGKTLAQFTKPNPYMDVENLFYCLKCNFASPSTKGVLQHQSLVHTGSPFGRKNCVQYSALVVKKIKKSKSRPKDLPFHTGLPLPLMLTDDERRFFCHYCNYRHDKIGYVARHFRKVHSAQIHVETIEKYSAFVHEQNRKLHVKLADKNALSQASEMKTIIQEEKADTFPVSAPSLIEASQNSRIFPCHICTYNSRHVYLVRRHMYQVHRFKTTAANILNEAFEQGVLPPGYHCEFCFFTHHDVLAFYTHYEQKHSEYKRSFKHVSTQLYVGNKISLQKIKSKIKYSDDGSSAPNNGSLSWQEKDLYRNKTSKDGFGSVGKKKNHNLSSIEDLQGPTPSARTSEVFESYQEPLDFDNLSDDAAASPTLFKCPYCCLVLNSEQNLSLHCKTKHYATEQQEQVPVINGVQIFRCLDCAYVHTKYYGVFSHYQKKHPYLKPRVERIHVDMRTTQNSNHKSKNSGSLTISGYICITCKVVFKKLDRLKKHCEIAHVETTTSRVPASGTSNATLSKIHSSQKLKFSKASLMYKYKFTKLKCPHCSFVCCSQPRLDRHLIAQHKFGKVSYKEMIVDSSGSSLPMKDDKLSVYRCPKCSYVNTRHHGILTHCQMKHPKLQARAYNLKTTEIFLSNIVKPILGKASNQTGHLCMFCHMIYPSSSQLKLHYLSSHNKRNGSDTWKEMESQPVTTLPNFPKSEEDDHHQTHPPKTFPSMPLQTISKMYKCHMCSYRGQYRRYLQVHYRKTHKVDEATTCKLLQKYNKLKAKKVYSLSDPTDSEIKESTSCVKCPHLTFNSTQQLVNHYSLCHPLIGKTDFIIVSTGEKKKSTGVYRCCHCIKQLNGIRKLSIHLNNHRAEKRVLLNTAIKPWTEPIKLCKQGGLSPLEVGENKSQLITTAEEIIHTSISPLKLHSELDDEWQPLEKAKHACDHCGRMFMSMKGLISHERSHAAVAGLKNLYDGPGRSGTNPRADRYLCYKSESGKPFTCQLCSYRTTTMGLWRRHFNRLHPDLIGTEDAEESAQRTDNDSPKSSDQMSSQDELDEENEPAQCSLYMEPPDVQRQLSHYSMMAQGAKMSKTDLQKSKLPESSQFHCELCRFTSEHLSSIRRHYLHRHGKKILRCKACNFITCSKATLQLHVETGHSASHSERPHQKDFHCPFCLYQTQNKNYMIDHIVLHREERVVPIEISRPKLSHYLKGIVFRCHKCTFSCGDAENLSLHMSKHEDVRPYKCQLCFFDCADLSDLEAHLSDKHQVLRNHQLVGQVNLEHLEARVSKISEVGERWLNRKDHESLQSEELLRDDEDRLQAERLEDNSTNDRVTVQINETNGKENGEGGLPETSPVWTMHTKEQTRQDAQKSTSDRRIMVIPMLHSERAAEDTEFKMSEQEHNFKTQCTTQSKEALIEDNILRNIMLLDDDGHFPDVHNTPGQRAETKQTIQAVAAEENEIQSLDELDCVPLAPDLEKSPTAALSPEQVGNEKAGNSIPVQKQPQMLPPVSIQLATESNEVLCSYSKIKDEEMDEESQQSEPFREMPVLENEYLKEKRLHLKCEEENNEEDNCLMKRKQKNTCVIKEEDRIKSEGMESDGVSEALTSSPADVELYTCDFCGRNLESSSDLKRHVMRHGM